MIEFSIEPCPQLAGIVRSVEPVATRGDVLVRLEDVNVMDVVVNAVGAFSLRLALIVADVDATDLDAGDYSVEHLRVHTKTPHVGFVTVASD